ncbi:MAG: PQQ-binding-like beta-propeller repeat protein, partial [Planctomycetota bacterium]|nr:PQQ-binding-like beta-propeller repeat protein [Planctomycetota bacterium]
MRSRPVRWWPAVVVTALSGAVLAWNWLGRDASAQERVIGTLAVLLLTTILLLIWSLVLAGFPRRVRWSIAGALVALITLGFALLDLKGFTGDLVPIIGWRYSSQGAVELPVATGGNPRADAPSIRLLIEYPGFLGPERDGEIRGVTLERDWTARPPKELWRREVGAGWSGFAVAGDAAFTQEQRGELETVVCYDLAGGDVRWVHSDEAGFDNKVAGDGPRATPTVTGTRVYTLGATGILNCLDRFSGERVWSRRILEDSGAVNLVWGLSGSPLVTGGLVVVNAGGSAGRSLVAYDAETGERIWSGGSARAAYASPQIATLAGAPQILIFNHASLAGHDPEDGRVLWEVPWSGRSPNVAQLVPVGDDALIVSAGYGDGCARYRIARDAEGGFTATQAWRSRRLKA